jgi:hypothetical protein
VISALYNKLRQMPKLKVVSIEKMSVHLSGMCCNIDALWFKVKRTPISPIDIEPVKCCIFFVFCFVKCNKSELVYNFQL